MIAQNNYNANERALTILSNVISFKLTVEMISKWYQQTGSLTWFYDSNNYIEAFVDANNFYLNAVEDGVLTSQHISLDYDLEYNERVEMRLIKNIDSISATICKNGEIYKTIEYETTISSSSGGNLYLGYYGSAGFSLVTDFTVSNNNIDDVEGWKLPKILVKTADESLSNTTTLQSDDELWCYLPPNGLYEVDCNLLVDGTDSGQDIIVQWSTQDDVENYSTRVGFGPGRDSTDIYDATLYAQGRGLTTNAEYGVVSAGWSYINEKVVFKTGNVGGKVALTWAQRVSSATEIIVKAGSYMKVTKVKAF